EKGAEKNNKDCLLCLFRHYEDKDDVKAFSYLVRLADLYHTHEYTLQLARWYEEGRGCEKNEKKAFELAEYVYKHSSSSPYDNSHEDSVDLLCRYLKNGIGCKPDYERAIRIQREFKDDEDRMWELLTK
ncbi:MAG: sel1 repeat family protein, partial [Paludibacteraceae bacterium]|nr:sel1 repeat family protein [Paludibacteraceae bacterium]